MKRRLFFVLFFFICIFSLASCGKEKYSFEKIKNTSIDEDSHPYIVNTDYFQFYIPKEDLSYLGEKKYYKGLENIIALCDLDAKDAIDELSGYVKEDIPKVKVYTDFKGVSVRANLYSGYYDDSKQIIYLYSSWESANSTLLHEYIHYLTMNYGIKCTITGFYSEGIAEYVSKMVCKNRMARSVNMNFPQEDLDFLKNQGAWDTTKDTIDLYLYMLGTGAMYYKGYNLGTKYFAASQTMMTRTQEILDNPTTDNASYFEAAGIMAYLVKTYGKDKVYTNWVMPNAMEEAYELSYQEIYSLWGEWNYAICKEKGFNV